MFGALSLDFFSYEYLDANIYNVTQCISTRRHGYRALTVLLIINRSLFLLTCTQTDSSHEWMNYNMFTEIYKYTFYPAEKKSSRIKTHKFKNTHYINYRAHN